VTLACALIAGACTTDGTRPGSTDAPDGTGGPGPAVDLTRGEPLEAGAEGTFSIVMSGDSVMNGLYPAVEAALERSEPFGVEVDWLLTAGIADAPEAQLLWRNTIAERDPDVSIFLMGWWENIRLRGGNLSISTQDEDWPQLYLDQVAIPWRELVTSGGGDLIWMTMPPVVAPERNPELEEFNAAWRPIADQGSTVVFETAPGLTNDTGRYLEQSLVDGELLQIRNPDGLHMCQDGAIALAEELLGLLRERYGLIAVPGWQTGEWQSHSAYPPDECNPES